MAFRNDAAATRANIQKRLRAADEALGSAAALAARANENPRLRSAIANAGSWNEEAKRILRASKGKRR